LFRCRRQRLPDQFGRYLYDFAGRLRAVLGQNLPGGGAAKENADFSQNLQAVVVDLVAF